MQTRSERGEPISPVRLLEMLEFRFGAFEAIASASLELARKQSEESLPMDDKTADAILEFGDDLRQAYQAAKEWVRAATI
jgi:hypothetical protein